MMPFNKRIKAFCVKQRTFLSAYGEKFFQGTALTGRPKRAVWILTAPAAGKRLDFSYALRFLNKVIQAIPSRVIVAGSGIDMAPLKPLPPTYPPSNIWAKLR